MAKKSKEKQPPPPPPPPTSPSSSSASSSSTSSSDDGEDSPPPVVSPVMKPAAGSTAAVHGNHPEPSLKSIDGEEEEEEGSETEEESTDEESSEDSGAAPAKSNPPQQPRDSVTADGKQASNISPTSDSGTENGEEDGEELDSSSESEQRLPPPLPQAPANAGGKKASTPISGSVSVSEDESESSSDSDMTAAPPRGSSRDTADPSLKPLSSKPMDSPSQPADKSPISGKRSATPITQISEKKRKTADIIGAEGGQEKKEISRRIWSRADELALLQCILDYKGHHHVIPSTQMQVESLMKSVNDSLSSSVTLNQLNDKIRRLKLKYTNIIRVNGTKSPNIYNAHDAAVFDLSRMIWGPGKEESVFPENNFKPEKKENIKKVKGKSKPLAEDYSSLRWHAKSVHANNASVVQSHIPIAEAKELEGRCKKLEMTEIQLHMQKTKLLPSALKLIEDALAK